MRALTGCLIIVVVGFAALFIIGLVSGWSTLTL